VQEVAGDSPGRRLILIHQRIAERPEAAGKTLLDLPGYRFQALVTNLPISVNALQVWRRYNGRADVENRIRELGNQFGIKRLCVNNFWGTEAMHHLAIAADNLCVLLQRRLGQLEKRELNTLRWRLFSRAAVWSRARGKPTLKLVVRGGRKSKLVGRNPQQTYRAAQLQCNWFSPRINSSNPYEIIPQLNRSGKVFSPDANSTNWVATLFFCER